MTTNEGSSTAIDDISVVAGEAEALLHRHDKRSLLR